jgi:integrase
VAIVSKPLPIPKQWDEIVQIWVPARYRDPAKTLLRDILSRHLLVSVPTLLDVLKQKAPVIRKTSYTELRLAAVNLAKACRWDPAPLCVKQVDLIPEDRKRPSKLRKRSIERERLKALVMEANRAKDKRLFFALILADHYALRLAEIPNLNIELKKDGNYYLVIKGAKRTVNRGSNRSALIPASEIHWHQTAVTILRGCNAERLRKNLWALDKKLFPSHDAYRVTIHRIRDQVASDLKASGVSMYQTAALLGHRSQKSTEHYGNRRRGKRKRSPIEVLPEVRPKSYTPHAARQRTMQPNPVTPAPRLKPR